MNAFGISKYTFKRGSKITPYDVIASMDPEFAKYKAKNMGKATKAFSDFGVAASEELKQSDDKKSK